ncbi:MAG: HD domain-containing protein [Thermodesulfovibrionia bacterium]
MIDNLKKVISNLNIAISNCLLYSKDHGLIEDCSRNILEGINEISDERLEIMMIEDDLVINKIPLKDAGLHGVKLIKRLKRMGISRIEIMKDVTPSEIKQFIIDMSDGRLGKYPHIRVGAIDIRLDLQKGKMVEESELSNFTDEQIQRVKEIFYSISPFRMLNVVGIEEIVTDFMMAFQKEAGILKLLNPVRSKGEHVSTHSTNVAILSIFQAESLGLNNQIVHDIGVSALLHDVGKLFILNDIQRQDPPSYKEEASKIRQHPVYGAIYLAKVEKLTRLAPIVAFEHHMGYDGGGYPQFRIGAKRQHLSSQIVAISDFFDSLRGTRFYQRSWEIRDILAVMKMNAGRQFNPFLVDNFIRNIMQHMY